MVLLLRVHTTTTAGNMLPLTTIAAGLLLCGVGNAAPSVDLEFEERSLASRFKYYDMPTKEAGPCDITTGPDGNIWVQDFLVNKLARIDPNTGAIKEYTIPYKNKILNITLPGQAPGRTGLTACVVQPGEDGYLYAASGVRNEFLKVNTKTGQIKIFDTGNLLGNLQPLNDVYRGPTGVCTSRISLVSRALLTHCGRCSSLRRHKT